MTEPQKIAPFDPGAVQTRYRYELLAEHLAQLIYAGELKPNVPLPAERRLAEQFGVSLGTARHATEVLRGQGLVITLPGKGTFVTPAEQKVWDGQA